MTQSGSQAKNPLSSRQKRERVWRIALRLSIGLVFASAGASKLAAKTELAEILSARNLPAASAFAVTVGLGELLGGLLLIAGWKVRWVAAALAAFVAVASVLLHFPIALVGPRALEFGIDASVVVALYVIAARDPSLDERWR